MHAGPAHPPLPSPYSFSSTSVTYLHEAGTKWKFVAALLIAMDAVAVPASPTNTYFLTSPATFFTLHPSVFRLSPLPAPSARLSHMCVLVAILMCQVFYLRVLPTLILFAHLPGKSGRKPANFMQKRSGGGGKSGVECAARRQHRRGCIAVPSRLAFMFNSCANCRGNLASSVLNAVRCF